MASIVDPDPDIKKAHPRGWIRDEFERQADLWAALPVEARPVVTRPVVGSRESA